MSEKTKASMISPSLSLSDLLGKPYTDAVCEARAFLDGVDQRALVAIAEEKVNFAPECYVKRIDELVDYIGQQVCSGLSRSAQGAGTASFKKATNTAASPLTSLGFIRIGENGKAYLTSKSEHYHASLGHAFPGYRLIENAKRLGIPNATHNNTRGHITRLLEQELIRSTNGIPKDNRELLSEVVDSLEPHVLNRVINLETGSLAVEAALKMMLARFFRPEDTFDEPQFQGRIPVFLVIADKAGGKRANYHGTTVLTQVMRGMWPEFSDVLESNRVFIVKQVRINDIEDFEGTMRAYDSEPYKIAGFFHEIVLMNYGGIVLDERFLKRAYELCDERDVPILVDEIQSCLWSPELFLFREYGLRPDFVSVGKGFPGGEYSASRIITTSVMDNLNQFGALVTNGQEELASLAYLVTMEFAQVNSAYTRDIGDYYESELNALARKYPAVIDRIEGIRHLSTIVFYSVNTAVQFIAQLSDAGIDISAHTYKAEFPPVALTKIPLISSFKMVDFLISKMHEALKRL